MPSLVWCGRAWRVGSDDFVFSSVLHALLLTGSGVLVACRLNTSRDNYLEDCDGASTAWGRAMLGLVCVNLASAVLFICTAVFSLRGGVFEVSKRSAVPVLLYFNSACIVCIFVLTALSAKYAIYDGEATRCTLPSTRHMLRGAIVIDFLVFALHVTTFLVAFDPSGRRVYRNSSDYAHAWWTRFRICCCRCGKRSQTEDAYTDLAQVFAVAFRGYDIVPSDIAAGTLLLHGYQSRSRRLLSRMVDYGPNPHGYPERVSSQARPAQRLTAQQREWARELQQYSRFFMAAYGWLLFEFRHCGSGLARLCCFDPCMCCRHHPGHHRGQRCYCDLTALLHETHLPEEDVLLTSWENKVFKPVHYVAYDRASDSIIVAIRGSMSIDDCITDFAALPVTLELHDTPPDVAASEYYAHGGMVRCATYVVHHLRERGLLQQLVRGRFATKRVVLLGHSLGAGVALILSAILWSDNPELRGRLRCLAYAPPGGTVSRAVMEYQKDFVAAACMGYDMIPRLAQHTFDTFRESIFDVLAASDMNKNVVFLNALRTAELAKSFHPATATEAQGRRSSESASHRAALHHSPCIPTRETKKLYNCMLMIHYVKVVEVCTQTWCVPGCRRYSEEVYIPVVRDLEAVQMLLASPTMFADHVPDRFYRVMQTSMALLDSGELDRFYVDDITDLAPCLEEAPMFYVDHTPTAVTDAGSVVNYGAAA
ncbi:Lipase (class 3) [Novymonas esmeraldas]|uniref:sn-1-specific diacylglycerol lipase n=1 Tax=Novymonas esmeraldas TaxID=1808958 RepID=A0AAW0EPN7_9TRYP